MPAHLPRKPPALAPGDTPSGPAAAPPAFAPMLRPRLAPAVALVWASLAPAWFMRLQSKPAPPVTVERSVESIVLKLGMLTSIAVHMPAVTSRRVYELDVACVTRDQQTDARADHSSKWP